jgi:MoxR-like ATPase
MVRLILDYPSPEEETQILAAPPLFSGNAIDRVETLSFPAQALQMVRQHLAKIVIDDKIIQYVRDIIRMSRSLDQLILGNSPRAGQMLLSLARAFAAVNGYDFVTPDHIRELAPVVLPHRWIVKPEMEIQQTPVKTIIKNIFDSVKVPQ